MILAGGVFVLRRVPRTLQPDGTDHHRRLENDQQLMSSALAYVNGRLVQASQAVVPVYDQGFVQGVTIAEQLRTFGGKLFRLDDHLKRLRRSLEIIQVDPGLTDEQFTTVALELVEHNHALLDQGDDLGLCIFVTPGPYPNLAAAPDIVPAEEMRPRVVAHTFPIPFIQWSEKYVKGQDLAISSVRQVPTACWPAELKCRSRMHYYLADKEAHQKHPGSRAVLLDESGAVVEASTANVLVYYKTEGFVAPPSDEVLPGISLSMLVQLADEMNIPFTRRRMLPGELLAADEVLLCSTSPCVLPVCKVDGQVVGDGRPGQRFHELIKAWSDKVGIDVIGQASYFCRRETLTLD